MKVLLAMGFACLAVPSSSMAQWQVQNFESGPVRPVAMSPNGLTVAVTNIPDQRVELFEVVESGLVYSASVRVGVDPVALAFRDSSELWVVNHLSDSVSVVELSGDYPEVVRTLQVGDEPRDIVFGGPGGGLAFISTAHRGQHSPYPRGEFEVPGVGRADVWVFDASDVSSGSSEAKDILSLFGDKPRSLAVSADGSKVYVGVFYSGNGTTTIPESTVCDGGELANTCVRGGVTIPGGVPGPNENHEGVSAPETGLIVRWSPVDEAWLDELGRDWSSAVVFDLPDYDVFEIDASSDDFDVTARHSGVGTVLFNMTVDPVSDAVLVTNTEARNEVRFEGPGDFVTSESAKPAGEPASVIGHLHEARVTILSGDDVTPTHLNPHLDYDNRNTSPSDRARSASTPLQVEIGADRETVYVAAYSSDRVVTIPYDDLLDGTYDPDASDDISVSGGPAGFVLDESRNRIFVYTRFDNAVVSLDLTTGEELQRVAFHSPEPAHVREGRRFFYDAQLTSSNGESSCASCHVFGDTDGLAWDLGDPDGSVEANPNELGPFGNRQPFHPMKGPMLTQTFRGMDNHGPLHWRGDRTGMNTDSEDSYDVVAGFTTFNVAFEGLLGRTEGPLTDDEMMTFARFATGIRHPPNPMRKLDRSLRDDEAAGEELFFHGPRFDTIETCEGCHRTDPAQGFYGTDGRFVFEGEPQEFKIAQLRDLYQRVGMFGMSAAAFFPGLDSPGVETGPQVRGFGFLHDGSVDTVENFLHADVFTQLNSDEERDELEAFMMVFDGEMAPIVGQQVTLGASSGAEALAAATELLTRSGTEFAHPVGPVQRECDIVVHGVFDGVERGFVFRPEFQQFQSDIAGEPRMTTDELQAFVTASGAIVTLTAVTPGSGWRMGVDQDADTALDGDERALGTDPADASSVPDTIPVPADPPTKEIDCDEDPSAEGCEPPTCEEDSSQERCAELPTCEEDPSQRRCVEPPTCDEDPSQSRCIELCDDGSVPPCESENRDAGESSGCSSTTSGSAPAMRWLAVAFLTVLLLSRRRRRRV